MGLWHERWCLGGRGEEGQSGAGVGGSPSLPPSRTAPLLQPLLLLLRQDGIWLGLLPAVTTIIDKLCEGRSRLSQLPGEPLCRRSWLHGWNQTNPHYLPCVLRTSGRVSCESVCNVTRRFLSR